MSREIAAFIGKTKDERAAFANFVQEIIISDIALLADN